MPYAAYYHMRTKFLKWPDQSFRTENESDENSSEENLDLVNLFEENQDNDDDFNPMDHDDMR